MNKTAAIYHFTDKSEKRPIVFKKQLEKLKDYAQKLGYQTIDVYCDKSLKRSERVEFDKLLSCCDQYDAIITKDYYHIAVNTNKCMSLLLDFKKRGIKIRTLEDGSYSWEEAPFDQPLRVASYCCRLGPCQEARNIIQVQNDILKLFIEKETNWILIDQYIDDSLQIRGDQQKQLKKLIANKDIYDMIVVIDIDSINYRTEKMCKYWDQLQLNIYSTTEGYIQYRKEAIITN